MEPTRRSVLKAGLVAGTVAIPGLGAAHTTPASAARRTSRALRQDPFTLGVASGDPHPGGFVLWTRLALDPVAGDGYGGMPANDVDLNWQIATDENFSNVVRDGTAIASRQYAHAVHVQPKGLEPGREYFYRFRAGDYISPAGRTQTAPERGTMPSQLAMSFTSCQHYEAGWYVAYRALAADQPDLVLQLGDYLYEADTSDKVREHAGPEEIWSLGDYRLRHAQTKSDPDLQAAHAIAPWLVVWDDHETENNWAADKPQDPDDAPYFEERKKAAFRAYYENMPLRYTQMPEGPWLQLYRRRFWGSLATFHMLDTRQWRDDQGGGEPPEGCGDGMQTDCPAATDPARSLMGEEQEAWLQGGFERSRARWDVLGQQVFFAQLDGDDSSSKYVNMDAWDGYAPTRDRMQQGWVDAGVRNPLVLTGDVHRHWASDLRADYDDPDSAIVGSELVCSSITSSGDGEDGDGSHPWMAMNPHVKFHNALRGYVRTTITPDRLTADFRCVPAVTDPDAEAFTRRSYALDDGERGLQQTYDNPPLAGSYPRKSDERVIRETIRDMTS